MSNSHWSQTSYDFKILGLPAGPVVLTPVFLLLGQISTISLFLLVFMWIFYIVFVFFFKIKPRFAFALLRTWLIGKNRKPRNENNPLQY